MRRIVGVALALATLATAEGAPAQVGISRDLFEERLRQQGDAITFCVVAGGMLESFDRSVAQAIGDALLVEARIRPVRPAYPMPPLDYRAALSENEIFMLLAQECDAFMGFPLARDGYRDWLALTPEYFRAPFVLVGRSPGAAGLSDLPAASRIAVRSLSAADNRLILYLAARGDDALARRMPFHDHRQVIAALVGGRTAAAMIWAPALAAETGGDPEAAGFHPLAIPFPTEPVRIGIAVSARNRFLQQMLADGIRALEADGVLARLADEAGLTLRPGFGGSG